MSSSLTWRSHPLASESAAKTVLLFTTIAVSVIASFYAFGVEHAVLAVIILFLATAKYFTPTTFFLDDSGVKITFLCFHKVRNWNYYKRYLLYPDGAFLTPSPHPSRLDRFRGDFLPLRDPKKIEFFLKKISSSGQHIIPSQFPSSPSKLQSWYDHAFHIDSGRESLTEADYELLDRVAHMVVKRKLATPAILFIESVRPLNFMGSSLMTFLRPIIAPFITKIDYERLEVLLMKRCIGEVLIERIERVEKIQGEKEHD
ncbi:MAG: hypothetical protein HQK50_09140 [Oligoflexia bacterium]|nr:hypothetical protein [Oligoflexia bacterium]MBF0365724.1 hypothetical protein [Oligoflexia bacterium]